MSARPGRGSRSSGDRETGDDAAGGFEVPRFLIEVPHEAETIACARAVKVLLSTGSHWITHADWGCTDGVHKGWIIVDVASKDEARQILPSAYRTKALITQLNSFSLAQMDELLRQHGG